MMRRLPEAYASRESASLDALTANDDLADRLEGEILRYLAELRKEDLTSRESIEFQAIMMTTDALESIGDVLSDDIVEIGRRRLASDLHASESMKSILASLYQQTLSCLEDVLEAFRDEDLEKAQSVLDRQGDIDRQIQQAYLHQEDRFLITNSDRLEVFRSEMKLVEKLRRVYSLSKRIARALLLDGGK